MRSPASLACVSARLNTIGQSRSYQYLDLSTAPTAFSRNSSGITSFMIFSNVVNNLFANYMVLATASKLRRKYGKALFLYVIYVNTYHQVTKTKSRNMCGSLFAGYCQSSGVKLLPYFLTLTKNVRCSLKSSTIKPNISICSWARKASSRL